MKMENIVMGEWLSEAVLSRRWCDVSILCDGKHFWAHRLVLSTASPFIRGLLLSRPSEDVPTTIVFADFSYHIVEALLQYIYCGEVSVLPEHVEDFLSLSQALKIHVDLSSVSGYSEKAGVLNLLKNSDTDIKSDVPHLKYRNINISHESNMNYNEKNKVISTKMENGNLDNNKDKLLELETLMRSNKVSNTDNVLSHLIVNNSLPVNYKKQLVENLIVDHNNFYVDKNVLDNTIQARRTPSSSIKNNLLQNMMDCNYIRTKHSHLRDIPAKSQVESSFDIIKPIVNNNSRVIDNFNGISQVIQNSHYPVKHINFTSNTHPSDQYYLYKRDSIYRNETGNCIPSLIPIHNFTPNSHHIKMNRLSDVLDLSNNQYEHPSGLIVPVNHKRYRNDTMNYLCNGEVKKQFSNSDSGLNTYNENDMNSGKHSESEKRETRISKYVPQNKVLDSPWATKGPVFYCHKIKRARESQRETLIENSNEIVERHECIEKNETPEQSYTKNKSDNNNNTNGSDDGSDDVEKPKVEIDSDDTCASKCPSCAKMFTSKATLAAHIATHATKARYRCDQCDKSFSQLRNYKYHISVHRGTKEFAATCNVCGKYFNDRGYLSSHMKIHRNRKEYQCPHCPKSFNQRVAYNMHVRIHTGVKPHQCEACGKAFSRKMLLKQHARTHSGEKPYACTSCGKRFADRSNMTLHMRLHSGVKPFSCDLCSKSFTKKHHLKTHLNYHTGDKPYACTKCGLTFSQSSNMRTHMKKCSPLNNIENSPTFSPEVIKASDI